MTLEKAIRVNNDTLRYWNSIMDTELKEAIKLGNEALKRHLTKPVLTPRGWLLPLPGETEE